MVVGWSVKMVNFQAFPTNIGSSNHRVRKAFLVESPWSAAFLCSPSHSFLSSEPVCGILPSLQRKMSPVLVFHFPAQPGPRWERGMALLSSPLWLCVMQGVRSKCKAQNCSFCFYKSGFWEQNALSNDEAVGQNLPSLLQSCLSVSTGLQIWQTDECPEQKAILRAHNRTENRTARWGIVAPDSWVHSACQESYCTGNVVSGRTQEITLSNQGKVAQQILDRSCWLCVDVEGDGGQVVSGTPNTEFLAMGSNWLTAIHI